MVEHLDDMKEAFFGDRWNTKWGPFLEDRGDVTQEYIGGANPYIGQPSMAQSRAY